LAGGISRRFGKDKGLLLLGGKPLFLHVLEVVSSVVDEVLVVVSSATRGELYKSTGTEARIVTDNRDIQTPLVGALTGFESALGEYSLLLSCDTPFVSRQIASLLLELCVNRDAVIPLWSNGYIEPLQAAYRTESAWAAANSALKCNKRDMRSMIAHLDTVHYLQTSVLKRIDPRLLTFYNVNTPEKLEKAELIRRRSRR
jgi:molybdopterin-guanine dinucleotide biosynthesis protein A